MLPLAEKVESLRGAFFRTVLTLVRKPFFFSSFGTGGPSCAGELMLADGWC